MTLNLKGFSQLLQDMTAALQGSATTLIDVTAGSVLRAVFEATASIALWLQWLILQVLQTTRAATSTGTDLDSWMNDFGLSRLPASAARGQISFSRFATTLPATIPAGAVLKTTDGSLSFTVSADPTQSTWLPASSAYVMPSGVSSITVPAECATAGASGNVLANAITIIASSLPGVDAVINQTAFAGGSDAETDEAFRVRFRSFLGSLSRATLLSIHNAATSIQQNLAVTIQENTAPDGSVRPGFFLVTVDDGSGYPPASLLSSVATAVENVRPIGSTYAVLAPTVQVVNVQMAVTLSQSASAPATVSDIQTLVTAYLNGLSIGGTASATRIAQKAYSAGDAVLNVTGVLLNGQPTDVVPAAGGVVKAGQITVTTNGG